jgi:hypothetical protein
MAEMSIDKQYIESLVQDYFEKGMHLMCVDSGKPDNSQEDVLVMCTKDEDRDALSILFPRYKVKVYICVKIAIT